MSITWWDKRNTKRRIILHHVWNLLASQSASQLSVCVFLTRLSDVLRPKGDSSLKWARLDIVRGPGDKGMGGGGIMIVSMGSRQRVTTNRRR
jgi:hypothetical protein